MTDPETRPRVSGWAPAPILLGVALCAVTLAALAAEVPGDPARGKVLFEASGCGSCHRPSGQDPGMGPALEVVRRPQGVLELGGRLWNHAPAMFAAFQRQALRWPELSREQMADLAAYLQADPARDPEGDPFRGRVVLVRKGCLKCHRLRGEGGAEAIELTQYRGRYESPVGWATTVWSHAPPMASRAAQAGVLYPRFTGDEMGQLFHFLKAAAGAPR